MPTYVSIDGLPAYWEDGTRVKSKETGHRRFFQITRKTDRIIVAPHSPSDLPTQKPLYEIENLRIWAD